MKQPRRVAMLFSIAVDGKIVGVATDLGEEGVQVIIDVDRDGYHDLSKTWVTPLTTIGRNLMPRLVVPGDDDYFYEVLVTLSRTVAIAVYEPMSRGDGS